MSDKLTREDALTYLQRFPAQGRIEAALNLLAVLAGNTLVFWLLWSGQLRAAHLIALVMVEAALLIAISWGTQRLVPRSDWLEAPKPWRERLFLVAFMTVWLGGAYSATLLMLQGWGDFLALRSPQAWLDARLHWPLLYTLAFALVHAGGDLAHHRSHGGKFQSNVAHDAMARYLTLILGGIPFAMPFFAVVIGGFKGVEYVAKKARLEPGKSALVGIVMMAVAWGSFALVSLLMTSGVTGWAIGFVFAKLISEVLVACIPLVMQHVAKHGP